MRGKSRRAALGRRHCRLCRAGGGRRAPPIPSQHGRTGDLSSPLGALIAVLLLDLVGFESGACARAEAQLPNQPEAVPPG